MAWSDSARMAAQLVKQVHKRKLPYLNKPPKAPRDPAKVAKSRAGAKKYNERNSQW